MPRLSRDSAKIWILIALAALPEACGKTNFARNPNVSETAATESQSTPTQSDSNSNPEEVTAIEPVSVGGAFLNCLYSQNKSSADRAAVECDYSSQGAEPARAQDLVFSFATGPTRAAAAPIKPDSQDFAADAGAQIWAWTFYFKRADISGSFVYTDIQDTKRAADLPKQVDVSIAPFSVPPAAASAAPAAVALVSWNSGPQKLGDDGAGVAVETACAAIDKTTIPIARSKTLNLTLTVATTIAFTFSDLCGVGTGNTNTAGSFTTAALKNSSNAVVFSFNLSNIAKLAYVSAQVPAGTYSLVITPASTGTALNDFVYSNLLLEAPGLTVK